MELIIDILVLFIILGVVFKMTMWRLPYRILYSLLLAAFAYWSVRYAVLQSKTQIADMLQNTDALQSMAILVTIDSAVGLAFSMSWLNGKHRMIWYNSLLMFPVVFYLLTQTVFASTGVDFSTTGLLFAAGLAVGLPIVAEIVFRILPEATSRVETYLLLMVFITVLGLIATETGRMVYSVKEEPTDLRALLLTFSGFALMFLVGIVVNKIKNRLLNK